MSKKMQFSMPSLRDSVAITTTIHRTEYTPTFDHIDNIFNDIETYPQPNNIKTGDRFIRTKNDARIVGNMNSSQPSLEMDFIEESPLCIMHKEIIHDKTDKTDRMVQIWNCQKEVQLLRNKKSVFLINNQTHFLHK